MSEMQPECGAGEAAARDRDNLSNLSGTLGFNSGTHAVSVSVTIPAPGNGEGAVSDFQLQTNNNRAGWVARSSSATRPSKLEANTAYTSDKPFAVKVTYKQAVVPATNPATTVDRERSVSVTALKDVSGQNVTRDDTVDLT